MSEPFRPGDGVVEILRKILQNLDSMDPENDPRPADTSEKLLVKILNRLRSKGAVDADNDPRPGDLDAVLLRKILSRMKSATVTF